MEYRGPLISEGTAVRQEVMLLCDHAASMGITPSEHATSKVLTIVTALLLAIAVVRGIRAVSKRLW